MNSQEAVKSLRSRTPLHCLNSFICSDHFEFESLACPLLSKKRAGGVMKTRDYLSLIIRNSLRNRRRSLLTISSLAVSLSLLGLLMAMYRALFFGGEQSPAQALRMVTHN